MKKKVSINIDEDLHMMAKKIAIDRKMLVSELYEEMIREFVGVDKGQTTLDDKIE